MRQVWPGVQNQGGASLPSVLPTLTPGDSNIIKTKRKYPPSRRPSCQLILLTHTNVFRPQDNPRLAAYKSTKLSYRGSRSRILYSLMKQYFDTFNFVHFTILNYFCEFNENESLRSSLGLYKFYSK